MSENAESITCPICGELAEAGALYGRSWLSWMAGAVNWKNRLTALYSGETVGEVGWYMTGYANGIYCRSCNHIVIPKKPRKKHYPDLKE